MEVHSDVLQQLTRSGPKDWQLGVRCLSTCSVGEGRPRSEVELLLYNGKHLEALHAGAHEHVEDDAPHLHWKLEGLGKAP